jgi:poly-gamma-glutamate synthesis protein (capsule biosynthesis protein)
MTDIFLSGDVMTGRGIDQILRHPGDPTLHERWARSAIEYVNLAEQRNGPVPRGVDPSYVWGDALEILDEGSIRARIINLETAITDAGEPWPGKGIHYRMHPGNIAVISTARIHCCVLANNHVLDWSEPGLIQTVSSLSSAGAVPAGAGPDFPTAAEPAVLEVPQGRVIIIAVGSESSGIPSSWAAGLGRPGVAMTTLSPADIDAIAARIADVSRQGDLVVVSIHWGANWGYHVPPSHRRFAHDLIDRAGAHVVHGHSSHHPMGIEVYRNRPILYGCGDLINDYEGIAGHETYRPGVGMLYLMAMDSDEGVLTNLELVPMRMHRFRLERAGADDREWLRTVISREGERFGSSVESSGDNLVLRW